jgi:hypothetical protein
LNVPSGKKTRRSTERYDFPSTIEYLVGSPTTGELYKAVTVNVSRAGIGAYVFAPHQEGLELYIKTSLPVDCHLATVRWNKKVNESFYLIGLQCNGAPLDF